MTVDRAPKRSCCGSLASHGCQVDFIQEGNWPGWLHPAHCGSVHSFMASWLRVLNSTGAVRSQGSSQGKCNFERQGIERYWTGWVEQLNMTPFRFWFFFLKLRFCGLSACRLVLFVVLFSRFKTWIRTWQMPKCSKRRLSSHFDTTEVCNVQQIF